MSVAAQYAYELFVVDTDRRYKVPQNAPDGAKEFYNAVVEANGGIPMKPKALLCRYNQDDTTVHFFIGTDNPNDKKKKEIALILSKGLSKRNLCTPCTANREHNANKPQGFRAKVRPLICGNGDICENIVAWSIVDDSFFPNKNEPFVVVSIPYFTASGFCTSSRKFECGYWAFLRKSTVVDGSSSTTVFNEWFHMKVATKMVSDVRKQELGSLEVLMSDGLMNASTPEVVATIFCDGGRPVIKALNADEVVLSDVHMGISVGKSPANGLEIIQWLDAGNRYFPILKNATRNTTFINTRSDCVAPPVLTYALKAFKKALCEDILNLTPFQIEQYANAVCQLPNAYATAFTKSKIHIRK